MADASPILLELNQLTKDYGSGKVALNGFDMAIRKGEFVSVIGSSGAGKSTMLRCINHLIEPTSGTIVFDGKDTTKVRGRELRHMRRRISMVFQNYNLVYRATAIENVLQGRLGYKSAIAGALGLYTEDEKRRAFEMLDHVGLADFAYTRAD